MRKSLIFIAIILSLFSCKELPNHELFVKEPNLGPLKNYTNAIFAEDFFHEYHFSYGEDSAKRYYTSETLIMQDTVKYFLRNCQATLSNKDISLQFSDTPFSPSLYELKILKRNKVFSSEFLYTISLTDSSYRPPIYKVIYQSIILDKSDYKKADRLKGKICLKVLGFHSWYKTYTDTTNIYGVINTVVE